MDHLKMDHIKENAIQQAFVLMGLGEFNLGN
jgi:hypothetical protein